MLNEINKDYEGKKKSVLGRGREGAGFRLRGGGEDVILVVSFNIWVIKFMSLMLYIQVECWIWFKSLISFVLNR